MSLNILVVDDERILNFCLVEYFKSKDYNIVGVFSADQAIDQLDKENYDIVICDVCLPRISGLAFLKMLRNRDPLISVIMMTGMTDKEIALECLANGASDFLYKPFRLAVIEEIISAIDGQHERWKKNGFLMES